MSRVLAAILRAACFGLAEAIEASALGSAYAAFQEKEGPDF